LPKSTGEPASTLMPISLKPVWRATGAAGSPQPIARPCGRRLPDSIDRPRRRSGRWGSEAAPGASESTKPTNGCRDRGP
jgi:hypothetical protein